MDQIVGGNGKAVFEVGNFMFGFPEGITDNSINGNRLTKFGAVDQLAIGFFLSQELNIADMTVRGIQWIQFLR